MCAFRHATVAIATIFGAAPIAAQQAPRTAPMPPYASIIGGVIDSINGGVLTGATVVVDGTDRQATVDSTGKFQIDSIPPGNHTIGVFHPLLDSLNMSLASKSVKLDAGTTTALLMATPSAPTAIAMYCSDGERQQGPAAVIGRVLAPEGDDPISDATVHYASFVKIGLSKDGKLERTSVTREAKVKPTGAFFLCGLPAGAGFVRATRGQTASGPVLANVSQRLLAIATVRLDTAKVGSAIVVGRIVDERGAAIAHVDVALDDSHITTSTTDSGTFALRDLPAGSETILLRKVGYLAEDTALMLSSKSPARLVMTLHTAPPRLSTVNVAGARKAALDRVGFTDRQKHSGGGTFLTEDQIKHRDPVLFSDIARTIPGLIVQQTHSGPIVIQGRGQTVANRGCVVYTVDGAPFQDIPRGAIDQFVNPDEIIGLEAYQPSEAPMTMATGEALRMCVVIAIWTKASSSG